MNHTLSENAIYNEDCLVTMGRMKNAYVDLTVTSPPYDGMRAYKGFTFNFESVARELHRITKQGGVVVWIVNDETKNGSESGTSFRQALYFMNLGFNLETMIWEKMGQGCLGSKYYYNQIFEYMFVLSKGFPLHGTLLHDRENVIKKGQVKTNCGIGINGKGKNRIIELKPYGKRNNIWKIFQQKKSPHPAAFPEQLVIDHILSWSNAGDLVYDPFIGGGTTAKAAIATGRRFIGSEIASDYCEIANSAIKIRDTSTQNII